MSSVPETIVIAGGGFAGVQLAQCLERILPDEIEIVLISEANHLVFTPMLPEVVGRMISPLHAVVAGRQLTRRTKWREARIIGVNRETNEVYVVRRDGSACTTRFTHLVFACGSAANLDEIPGLPSQGYPLKTITDAMVMSNDLIGRFEVAATEPDPDVRRRLLTVVVVGGGFSGVEIAGHIADLMRATHKFYPELGGEHPRVVLLHKGDVLIPELRHESLSRFALNRLQKGGLDIRLRTTAESATATAVQLTTGEWIETAMIVCTVGTEPQALIRQLGVRLQNGRLPTEPDMRVGGTSNLWALGDCSLVPNAYDGKPCPATAQFAVQQAKQLAVNLKLALRGIATEPFSFRSRGALASIGSRNAVAVIYGVKLSGFLAWWLWRGVYLWKLPTLRRKLEVGLNWAVSIPFPPNIVEFRLSPTRGTRREPSEARPTA